MKQTVLITLFLVFTFVQQSVAQERAITGKVTNENGNGIQGVAILIKGETNLVLTKISGKYTIKVAKGNILVFKGIGFETKEVLIKEQKVLNIILVKEPIMLEEINVVDEREKPQPAKPPEVIMIDLDDDIIPSPTEKFKPEKDMIEINPLSTKKIILKIGQKAYYQASEHGSVGIGVGVISKNSKVLNKTNTHFAYQRVQVRGMTGGDQATRTHIFEAKKVGKTKLIIRESFRGEITNKYVIKIIIK